MTGATESQPRCRWWPRRRGCGRRSPTRPVSSAWRTTGCPGDCSCSQKASGARALGGRSVAGPCRAALVDSGGADLPRPTAQRGFDVVGYNRTRGKVDRLVEQGGRAARTLAAAVRGADVVLTDSRGRTPPTANSPAHCGRMSWPAAPYVRTYEPVAPGSGLGDLAGYPWSVIFPCSAARNLLLRLGLRRGCLSEVIVAASEGGGPASVQRDILRICQSGFLVDGPI